MELIDNINKTLKNDWAVELRSGGKETYRMLADSEEELYRQSPLVVFDMWETEKITGNPRNSVYIRTE